jgi:hypothetical protein
MTEMSFSHSMRNCLHAVAVLAGMQESSDTFVPVNRILNKPPAAFASIFYLVD